MKKELPMSEIMNPLHPEIPDLSMGDNIKTIGIGALADALYKTNNTDRAKFREKIKQQPQQQILLKPTLLDTTYIKDEITSAAIRAITNTLKNDETILKVETPIVKTVDTEPTNINDEITSAAVHAIKKTGETILHPDEEAPILTDELHINKSRFNIKDEITSAAIYAVKKSIEGDQKKKVPGIESTGSVSTINVLTSAAIGSFSDLFANPIKDDNNEIKFPNNEFKNTAIRSLTNQISRADAVAPPPITNVRFPNEIKHAAIRSLTNRINSYANAVAPPPPITNARFPNEIKHAAIRSLTNRIISYTNDVANAAPITTNEIKNAAIRSLTNRISNMTIKSNNTDLTTPELKSAAIRSLNKASIHVKSIEKGKYDLNLDDNHLGKEIKSIAIRSMIDNITNRKKKENFMETLKSIVIQTVANILHRESEVDTGMVVQIGTTPPVSYNFKQKQF